MSARSDLPLRAEDAVAKLKRTRDEPGNDTDPNSKKRTTIPGVLANNDNDGGRGSIQVDSSNVWEDVSEFPVRHLGSVVYAPKKLLAKGHELQFNGVLHVKISHQFITSELETVKMRAVWGTDVYTDDTDIVAALHHLGYLGSKEQEQEYKGKDLLVDILLLPPLVKYTGCYRNNYNSRTWLTKHDGISYMVLGKPVAMTPGWAHAGKELLHARYEALKDLRDWNSRDIAYI